MIDINELRQSLGVVQPEKVAELLNRLEASEHECTEQARLNGIGAERELALMAKLEAAEKERVALKAKIEAMEQQEPVAWRWELKTGQYTYVDKPEHAGKNARIVPLYVLPGAQITKDAIIDDLQSQFDTEGITEHDIRGCADSTWKLVPNEPSQEMVRVATAEYVQACSRGLHPNIAWCRAFEAMISVAPKAKGEEK